MREVGLSLGPLLPHSTFLVLAQEPSRKVKKVKLCDFFRNVHPPLKHKHICNKLKVLEFIYPARYRTCLLLLWFG